MKIAIGSHHRGYTAKQRLMNVIQQQGHEVYDAGAYSNEFTDYPDFAFAVASKVGSNETDRGVLICGTGIGMAIAATAGRSSRRFHWERPRGGDQTDAGVIAGPNAFHFTPLTFMPGTGV